MGNINYSNFDEREIKVFVKNRFEDEQKSKLKRRDFMVVSDLLNAELPDEYKINFYHLGLLYCLDVDKDGRFYLSDLQQFGEEIMLKIKELKQKKLIHEIPG